MSFRYWNRLPYSRERTFQCLGNQTMFAKREPGSQPCLNQSPQLAIKKIALQRRPQPLPDRFSRSKISAVLKTFLFKFFFFSFPQFFYWPIKDQGSETGLENALALDWVLKRQLSSLPKIEKRTERRLERYVRPPYNFLQWRSKTRNTFRMQEKKKH